MKKARFYYSEELTINSVEVLLKNESIVAVGKNFKYVRNFPRITICGIYDDENNTMSFGVARCSSRDSFVKAKGRELSQNRAETKPYKIVKILPGQKVSDVFMANAVEIDEEVLQMVYPIKF